MKKKKEYIGDYGFLIWFNSEKKEEYYLTPFYDFGNLTQVTDRSMLQLKLEIQRNTNSISNYKFKKQKIEKTPFVVHTPYVEKIGTFLMRFLNTDFSCFEKAFDSFYCYYGIEFVDCYEPKELKKEYETEQILFDELKKVHNSRSEDFIKIQKDFKNLVDFIYNLNNNNEYDKYSPSEKLTACIIKNRMNISDYKNNTTIIDYSFEDNIEKYSKLTFNELLEEMAYDSFLLNTSNIYGTYALGDICYVVLNQIVRNNLTVRTCQNCGKYYIPNKLNEIYCDFLNDNGTTCREKGAGETYKKNLESIPGLLEYRRTYNKKFNAMSRNLKDTKLKIEFAEWKKRAQAKVKEYKQGNITEDELYEWMMENK